MIGVISKECEREVVEEFFQLFKTPWEFYDLSRSYEVVLSTTKEMGEVNAKLVMIYCSESTDFDANENIYIRSRRKATVLECDRVNIPIYGDAASLEGKGRGLIRLQDTSEFAGLKIEKCGQSILRVGYDIFGEILFLYFQLGGCRWRMQAFRRLKGIS